MLLVKSNIDNNIGIKQDGVVLEKGKEYMFQIAYRKREGGINTKLAVSLNESVIFSMILMEESRSQAHLICPTSIDKHYMLYQRLYPS